MLLITSCRRTGIVYPDRGGTFQYFDQVGVIAPDGQVESVPSPSIDRIAELMRARLARVLHGPPRGGAPRRAREHHERQASSPTRRGLAAARSYRRDRRRSPPTRRRSDALRELLPLPSCPLIHAGCGVIHAGAYAELRAVAELLARARSPPAGRARGVARRDATALVDPDGPRRRWSTRLRNEADLVLVLGSRLGETDWWGKAPYWAAPAEQKMIQVDIDDEILGDNRPADLAVLADVEAVPARRCSRGWSAGRAGMQPDCGRRQAWTPAALDGAATGSADKLRREARRTLRRAPMVPGRTSAAVCRQVFGRRRRAGLRRRQHGGLGATSTTRSACPTPVLTTPKIGMLGRRASAQALGAAVARPGTAGLLHHRRRRDGLPPAGDRDRGAQRAAGRSTWSCCDKQWGMVKMNQQFALKPVKTLVRKSLDADETINADLGEIAFDELARAMGAHGERVADPDGAARRPCERALATGRPRGDPRRRGPGQAHVGARPQCTSRTCTRSRRANDRDRRDPAELQPGIAGRAQRHSRVHDAGRRAGPEARGLQGHHVGAARRPSACSRSSSCCRP